MMFLNAWNLDKYQILIAESESFKYFFCPLFSLFLCEALEFNKVIFFYIFILVIEEPAGQPKNRQGPEEAKSYGRRGEKQAAMPKNWHARARDCQQVQHILSSNIFVIEYFCHRIFCYRIFRRRIFCVRVPFCHPIFAVEYFNRIFLSAFFHRRFFIEYFFACSDQQLFYFRLKKENKYTDFLSIKPNWEYFLRLAQL